MDASVVREFVAPSLRRGGPCPCCGTILPSPRGGRSFSLSDAMILVAALGLAFSLVRSVFQIDTIDRWGRVIALSISVLATLTPTLLFLRLRKPRPRIRTLARQPGFVASLVGTSIVMLGLLATGVLSILREIRRPLLGKINRFIGSADPHWWFGVGMHFAAVVGPAVIGAWILLAFSGRRRPLRNWLDYFGRAVGVGWILLFVVNCCARLAHLTG